jgi:hypothetical protein
MSVVVNQEKQGGNMPNLQDLGFDAYGNRPMGGGNNLIPSVVMGEITETSVSKDLKMGDKNIELTQGKVKIINPNNSQAYVWFGGKFADIGGMYATMICPAMGNPYELFMIGSPETTSSLFGGIKFYASGTISHVILQGGTEATAIDLFQNYLIYTRGHFLPYADNTYNLGNDSWRWALIRGVSIISGDLGFEELKCAVCEKKFKKNDNISLVVKKVEKDCIKTVPIHLKCNKKGE